MTYYIKRLLKGLLVSTPLLLTINHDFYSISILYSARVTSGDMKPWLNPLHEVSHSAIEDDYILVKILGDTYNPKDLKQRIVRVTEADHSHVFRKVKCVEGEWCENPSGFNFIQSGHAWVTVPEGYGYAVLNI